ncbi:cytochrome P450 [Streptomyces sp. XH2]|uniref:cytochrome P450 n=1 Tax=Streptomyces sp. XH2 TaxID=3412483 RepID=UPI003C7CFAE9
MAEGGAVVAGKGEGHRHGHPTPVHAAWTGVLLLQHPQWLPVLRAEQEAAFTDHPSAALSSLLKLERLDHCLLEAERLHPAVWLLARTAARDLCIHGYRVPRGHMVCVSPGASHRLPGVFRDPGTFDPDRCLPGRKEHSNTPYALIGFSGGRHPCLGMTFAQQMMKVIWSVLLHAFDLELADPDVREAREAREAMRHPPRRRCTVRKPWRHSSPPARRPRCPCPYGTSPSARPAWTTSRSTARPVRPES